MFSKFLLIALLPLLAVCQDISVAQEDPLKLNDIIVSGNTVGGDINVNNGQGGYDYESEGGDEGTFGDGCSVVGDSVHECDGTSRLMTATEKKRVNVRLARMQRSKRNMKNKSKKPLRKARRDMEEGEKEPEVDGGAEGGDDASPCHTCGSTGSMKARKNNARKNNAKNNAKKNVRKNNARKH